MYCIKKNIILTATVTVLVSCGQVAPKFIISGSSDFGFADYYLQPTNDSVVISDTDSTGTTSLAKNSYGSFLTDAEVETSITERDVKVTIFDTSYCSIFVENFSHKADADWLIDNSTNPSEPNAIISAALIAEKGYLEAMKNYCYSNTAFYLTDTRVHELNSDSYGKVRWFRNQSSSFGGNRTFDYLVSQAKNDNTTTIITRFKESGTIGQERYNGLLHFLESDTTNREIKIFRYFVDNATHADAIPDSLRWEAYRIKTSKVDGKAIHYIATNIIDYDKGRSSSGPVNQNTLIVQKSQFIVLHEVGVKQVRAEYCYYDIDVSTVDTFTNELNDCNHSGVTTSRGLANNRPSYYDNSGNLLVPLGSGGYSTEDLFIIRNLEEVDTNTGLQTMLDSLQPNDSGDNSGDYSRADILNLDTSNHLNF